MHKFKIYQYNYICKTWKYHQMSITADIIMWLLNYLNCYYCHYDDSYRHCRWTSHLVEPTSAPNWDVNRKISSAGCGPQGELFHIFPWLAGRISRYNFKDFNDPNGVRWKIKGPWICINSFKFATCSFFLCIHMQWIAGNPWWPPSQCRHAAIAKLTCFPLRILL